MVPALYFLITHSVLQENTACGLIVLYSAHSLCWANDAHYDNGNFVAKSKCSGGAGSLCRKPARIPQLKLRAGLPLHKRVGDVGFEPTASSSRTMRATTALIPVVITTKILYCISQNFTSKIAHRYARYGNGNFVAKSKCSGGAGTSHRRTTPIPQLVADCPTTALIPGILLLYGIFRNFANLK